MKNDVKISIKSLLVFLLIVMLVVAGYMQFHLKDYDDIVLGLLWSGYVLGAFIKG